MDHDLQIINYPTRTYDSPWEEFQFIDIPLKMRSQYEWNISGVVIFLVLDSKYITDQNVCKTIFRAILYYLLWLRL